MKKQDFLENLNCELDGLELPMSDRLKKEPIAVRTEKTASPRRIPRRIFAGISAGLAACVALVCVLSALPKPTSDPSGACLRVSVNPSVALILDENEKVVKAVSENADGDTLLQDESFLASVIGKSAEEGAKLILERAARAGYLDFSARGDDGEYNLVTLSYEGVGEAKENTLDGAKSALVEYFKEKGIFVYVETAISQFEGGASAFNEWKERPASFFEYAKAEERGEENVKEILLDYSQDLLLDCVRKYDLFTAIGENNKEIKQTAGELYSYWTISQTQRESEALKQLVDQTQLLLEQAYARYGDDYRELSWTTAMEFELKGAAYSAVSDEAEALRRYAEGERSLEELDWQEVLDCYALALTCGYGEEMLGNLQSALALLVAEAVGSVEQLFADTQAVVSSWASERIERFSAVFDLPREAIDDAAYEEFLKKIKKN